MPLHLMRLAVGIRDIEHLAAVQKKRARIQLPKRGGKAVPTYTTHMPKRTEEGRARCMILLDPKLVPTLPTAFRAFQGWRYFDPANAPADLAAAGKGAARMPPKMLAELRSLGLL
jgi:hypothetical protein